MAHKSYDISVLVLCYNAAPYIEECLNSVFNQKHNLTIELIVLDDASPDNSFAKINRIANGYKDCEVTVIQNEKNLGSYGNLKKGLQLCKGKYIAYLEGDDYWLSETKLQNQFNYLEQYPEVSGTGGRCIFVDEHGEQGYQKYYTEKNNHTWGQDVFWNYPPFQSSSFIFRVPLKLPDFDNRLHSNDKILYILCAQKGPIYYDSNLLSAYRYHSNNVSSGLSYGKVYRQHLKVNTLLLRHLGFSNLSVYIKSIAHKTYLYVRSWF